jgi:hypothetical protein
MVWRIRFTADDLDRIQVRPTLGPLSGHVAGIGHDDLGGRPLVTGSRTLVRGLMITFMITFQRRQWRFL